MQEYLFWFLSGLSLLSLICAVYFTFAYKKAAEVPLTDEDQELIDPISITSLMTENAKNETKIQTTSETKPKTITDSLENQGVEYSTRHRDLQKINDLIEKIK